MPRENRTWNSKENRVPRFMDLSKREGDILEIYGSVLAERAESFEKKTLRLFSGEIRFRSRTGKFSEEVKGLAERYRNILKRNSAGAIFEPTELPVRIRHSVGFGHDEIFRLYELYYDDILEGISGLEMPAEDAEILISAVSKRIQINAVRHLEFFYSIQKERLFVREIFYGVAKEIRRLYTGSESEPLERLFQRITDILVHSAGIKLAWLGRVPPNGKTLEFLAISGRTPDYTKDLTVCFGFAEDVKCDISLPKGECVVTDIGDQKLAVRGEPEKFRGLKGVASISFFTRNNFMWGLTVFSDTLFNAEICDLLKNISDDLRRFLENRDKTIELDRLRNYQIALEEIQQGLLHDLPSESIYALFVDVLSKKTDAFSVFTAVPDPKSEWIHPVFASGKILSRVMNLKISKESDRPYGNILTARVFRKGKPIILDLSESKAREAYVDIIKENSDPKAAVVGGWPIFVEGVEEPAGIIVISSLDPDYFSSDLQNLIGQMVSIVSVALKQNKQKDTLEWIGLHDNLTHLPNRLYFERSLTDAVSRARRERRRLAVGILDLDNFKEWNDTLGHGTGDEILKKVAISLESKMRTGDGISRPGGDEFAFHMSFEDNEDLERISERLFQSVNSVRREGVNITCSLGWAIYPDDGEEFATLFAHAEQALYMAKDEGKNTYRFFNKEIAEDVKRDFQIRGSFLRALRNDEIKFFLQPKGDCVEGRVYGLEMLVRWNKDGEWVPASDFMKTVEKDAGLVRELGRYAIEKAVLLRKKLIDFGFSLEISLNIGAKHFLSPLFLDDVSEFTNDGSAITVEITENSILENVAKAEEVIMRLKERGFRVSLDDFGTGYSSLVHALRLPVNEIKIDKDFISNFRKNTNAFAVTVSMIVHGELSKRNIIAEGIESPEDFELWARMGGRYIQGYYLGKPMPEDVFVGWMRKGKPTCRKIGRFDFEDSILLQYAFADVAESDILSRHSEFDDCPLTAWFSKRKKLYGDLSSFKEAEKLHENLHRALKGGLSADEKLVSVLHVSLFALYREVAGKRGEADGQ